MTFGEALDYQGKTWRDAKKILDALTLGGATGDKAKQEELTAEWHKLCHPVCTEGIK